MVDRVMNGLTLKKLASEMDLEEKTQPHQIFDRSLGDEVFSFENLLPDVVVLEDGQEPGAVGGK